MDAGLNGLLHSTVVGCVRLKLFATGRHQGHLLLLEEGLDGWVALEETRLLSLQLKIDVLPDFVSEGFLPGGGGQLSVDCEVALLLNGVLFVPLVFQKRTAGTLVAH